MNLKFHNDWKIWNKIARAKDSVKKKGIIYDVLIKWNSGKNNTNCEMYTKILTYMTKQTFFAKPEMQNPNIQLGLLLAEMKGQQSMYFLFTFIF